MFWQLILLGSTKGQPSTLEKAQKLLDAIADANRLEQDRIPFVTCTKSTTMSPDHSLLLELIPQVEKSVGFEIDLMAYTAPDSDSDSDTGLEFRAAQDYGIQHITYNDHYSFISLPKHGILVVTGYVYPEDGDMKTVHPSIPSMKAYWESIYLNNNDKGRLKLLEYVVFHSKHHEEVAQSLRPLLYSKNQARQWKVKDTEYETLFATSMGRLSAWIVANFLVSLGPASSTTKEQLKLRDVSGFIGYSNEQEDYTLVVKYSKPLKGFTPL